MKYFLLIILVAIVFCTKDSNPLHFQEKLQGDWVEYFKFKSLQYDDSTFASFLTFEDNRFAVSTYRDTFQMIPDTTYRGTFYAEKDTLRFYPGNWSEIFYMNFSDEGNLELYAAYSMVNGDKIGDFRSILWYTYPRKNGIFIRN